VGHKDFEHLSEDDIKSEKSVKLKPSNVDIDRFIRTSMAKGASPNDKKSLLLELASDFRRKSLFRATPRGNGAHQLNSGFESLSGTSKQQALRLSKQHSLKS